MLMARASGLGRLIPTPALNKIMLHRVVGGLEDPHLNCTLYLYNEPSTVTVSQSLSALRECSRKIFPGRGASSCATTTKSPRTWRAGWQFAQWITNCGAPPVV
eukprot:COSAG02_NODE_298_length_25350_cov_48.266999_30_plen_103_part_00